MLLAALPWIPLPGPQSLAYNSKADIIGYGGAAGGGKTDLACGLALTRHLRTILYRREGTQLMGIIDRFEEIRGDRTGFNSQQNVWRIPSEGRSIEFGGVKDPSDHRKYQGRPHDLKVFDEVTEMREMQVRFLMGWLRSSNAAVPQTVLMTFNPPTTAEGRWVIKFFGPWLDPNHPNPATIGELRWYTTHPETGEDIECVDNSTITIDGQECRPMSRTFIPAKVEDNPYYMESGYKRVLQALPEPLRSQMLLGDFSAGIEDDPWQVIPTAWVDAAMERWERPAKLPRMTMVAVDPSRGGSDSTVICKRHGFWFDNLVVHPGNIVTDGPTAAGLTLAELRDNASVNVDVIGIGSSVYDHLKMITERVRGVNVAQTTDSLDQSGQLQFTNLRAEMYWLLREALDPANNTGIMLPKDDKLKIELLAHRWNLVGGGKIQLAKKDDVKELIGRSPDRADAIALSFLRGATSSGNKRGRAPSLSIV